MKSFFCFLISGIMVGTMFSNAAFGDEVFTSSGAVSIVSEKALNGVSDWAEKEVREAIEKGLVPKNLQGSYTKNITREEFCTLCAAVMKAWGSNFEYKKGSLAFSDTNNEDVLTCAEKGIVSGVGDNKFAPNNPIKRQEAARMLYNTLNIGTVVISEKHCKAGDTALDCCVPHSFNDGRNIRNWARNEINHMYRYGVMLGVSNNNYDPDGYYTREQAICTFLRLFNCYGNMAANPIPEVDYYPYGHSVYNYISDGKAYAEFYKKEDYHVEYIDSKGNKYTEKEKGYVYPFNMPWSAFVTNVGPEVGGFSIIDKNGDYCLDTAFDNIDFITPEYLFGTRKYDYETLLYRFSDKKKILEGVRYMGENLYALYDIIDKPISIVNINGDIIVDSSKGYIYEGESTCYNGIFVLKNKSGFYSIINSKGEILKNFKVNPDWGFDSSVGSNMKFYKKFASDKGYIFYRAFSEKAFEYQGLVLTENNEIVAYPAEYYAYILNADGTVKFDCGKCEYVKKVEGIDLYIVYHYKDDNKLYDIVDKNGKVIKSINPDKCKFDAGGNGVYIDKSGICAYVDDNNVINFFDFFGNDLNKFDLNKYGKDKNKNIADSSIMKSVNGLFWVNIHYLEDSGEEFYITPYGKILK